MYISEIIFMYKQQREQLRDRKNYAVLCVFECRRNIILVENFREGE